MPGPCDADNRGQPLEALLLQILSTTLSKNVRNQDSCSTASFSNSKFPCHSRGLPLSPTGHPSLSERAHLQREGHRLVGRPGADEARERAGGGAEGAQGEVVLRRHPTARIPPRTGRTGPGSVPGN